MVLMSCDVSDSGTAAGGCGHGGDRNSYDSDGDYIGVVVGVDSMIWLGFFGVVCYGCLVFWSLRGGSGVKYS